MLVDYSIWHILAFFILIIVALIVDLFAHKKNESISLKNATAWSVFWILLSLLFALYIFKSHGADHGAKFISGYLLEKSLSVDNLFVFMAIFSSFAIKDEYQHRVLYYGIIGALIMRLLFITLGSSFLLYFGKWALLAFGLFVLWSAWKMWQASRKKEKEVTDYSKHWSVRLAKRFMPVSSTLDGHKFFTHLEGVWQATPLFLCLITLEIADVMFAFDSVPAIIAITKEPFLVYTSNIFAILGLRSMYFMLSSAKRFLIHLEKSVILILVFIGLKMLIEVADIFHISSGVSLIVVFSLLLGGVISSLIFKPKERQA